MIDAEKRNYYDWDITILNNSFSGKENYGRGYVSVSSKMVKSAAFRKLRANAKMMALYLLREWNINRKKAKRDSYAILKENFLNKFKELGFTNRMARAYLGELKPFLRSISLHLRKTKSTMPVKVKMKKRDCMILIQPAAGIR